MRLKYKPKLVRDKIPEIIKESGNKCSIHRASISEYQLLLYEKMLEELNEFIEDPSIEEAADMYEVFLTMLRHWEIDMSDVVFKAEDKRQEKGGFRNRIVLENSA